jgi:hypothetical protein
MTNRTDAHRPSALVATDYEFVEFCSAREFEVYDLAPVVRLAATSSTRS